MQIKLSKKNSPSVSIIVAVYNAECYIKHCLETLIRQTFKDIEFILIDDGSTDNSGRICDNFAKNDERIRVIHKLNEGIAATRQLGLEVAKGDFIIYVDSDDYIESDMIKKMYDCFTDDVDMVVCGYYTESSNYTITNKVNAISRPYDFLSSILEGKTMGALWNKMVRRSAYNDLRFHNDIFYSEDVLLLSEMLLRNIRNIKYLSCPLYHYVIHSNSLTRIVTRDSFKNKFMFLDYLESCLLKYNYSNIGIINILNLNYIKSMVVSQLYCHKEISLFYKKRKKYFIKNYNYKIIICLKKIELYIYRTIYSDKFLIQILNGLKRIIKNIKSRVK